MLERALFILEREFGPNHRTVAPTLVNLAIAYGALRQLDRQKDFLERALRINEREYGPDHRAVATTLVNLGSVYGILGDVEKKAGSLDPFFTDQAAGVRPRPR